MSWRRVASAMDALVAPAFGAPGYRVRSKLWDPAALDVDLRGKRVVVTGANAGIGLATTEALAARGAHVVMACRSVERGEASARTLRDRLPDAQLEVAQADMADLESVAALGRALTARDAPLHGLVHNAGALFAEAALSPQGFERTFALHVLGPFLLTRWLAPRLAAGGATGERARLVWVSSGGMYTQRLRVADLCEGPRRYEGAAVYAHAKRAQVVLARHWSERLGPRGVSVSAMHPGWADTRGVRDALPRFHKLTRGILRTPEQGADTIVWLVAAAEAAQADGGFYLDRQAKRAHTPGARTEATPAEEHALWALCARCTAPFAPAPPPEERRGD